MTELRVSSERDKARLAAALMAQPVVAAVLAYAAFPVIQLSGQPLYGAHQYSAEAAVAFAAGVAIVAVAVVVGGVLPALWWFLRRGPVRAEKVFLAGLVFGNVPFILVVLSIAINAVATGSTTVHLGRAWYGVAGAIRAILIGSTIGVLSAAFFWWMAPRRRAAP